MLLVPAIDLQNGKCVRLKQGEMERVTVFSHDPLATAERWVESGAKRLHIIDLDGALAAKPAHAEIIAAIASHFPRLKIQVGGGIRDKETIKSYVDCGVDRVIIGTRAVNNPDFLAEVCAEFPQRIIAGLDAKNEKLATQAWASLSEHNVFEFAQSMDTKNLAAIIFTDIARDGMRSGINLKTTAKLAALVDLPVYASGGFDSMEDVKALCAQKGSGIVGAIIGRALYDGDLDYAEAQLYANNH